MAEDEMPEEHREIGVNDHLFHEGRLKRTVDEKEIMEQLGYDDYVVPAPSESDAPLSRVLGSAPSGAYTDESEWFALHGSLTSSMKVCGRSESSIKNIAYMVSARNGNSNIARAAKVSMIISDCIRVSDSLQSDISYASTRNSALPKNFDTMSLLGVCERLGSGLAYYSMWGSLTSSILRGGGNVNLRAISAATDNIAVGPGNVFISKRATENIRPGTECALINAISGENGTPYSDLVSIDGNGVAQVPDCSGALLASGCKNALDHIGRIYTQCNQGPAFAVAVFRGVNKILTVAAHSGEGGHVRAVFRRGSYSPPTGAILLSREVTDYTGLPSPGGGVTSFRRLTFSILLGGAAGSANSDPLVKWGDSYQPTVLSQVIGDDDDPGIPSSAAVTDDERDVMQAGFASVSGDWASNYAYYLGVLFAAKGSIRLAQQHIQCMANDAVGINDKHLRVRVAVPFMWIEPTSVTPFRTKHLRAMNEDQGALVIHGEERKVPTFRDAFVETRVGDTQTSILMKMLNFRRHGALVHLVSNSMDGMANIHLYSGNPSSFCNVGGAGAMAGRILSGDTLDTFEWGRLHNQLPSIGEFIEYNERIRIVIDHRMCPDPKKPFNFSCTHAPTASDIVGKDVTYMCSPPRAIDNPGPLVADTRKWSRSRTAIAKALFLAKTRSMCADSAWGANIRPVLGDPMRSGPGVSVSDPLAEMVDGLNTRPYVVNDTDTVVDASEPSIAQGSVTYSNGIRVPLVIHNSADRGIRAPRSTTGGRGGGAGGVPPGRGGGRGGAAGGASPASPVV